MQISRHCCTSFRFFQYGSSTLHNKISFLFLGRVHHPCYRQVAPGLLPSGTKTFKMWRTLHQLLMKYKTNIMFWITTAARPEIILKCERLFSSRFWDTFEIYFDFDFRKIWILISPKSLNNQVLQQTFGFWFHKNPELIKFYSRSLIDHCCRTTLPPTEGSTLSTDSTWARKWDNLFIFVQTTLILLKLCEVVLLF